MDIKTRLHQHFTQLVPLTDDEFEYIWSHFSLKKFKKRQTLIQEGDSVKYHYWVHKGLIKSSHTDESGKEHILQFAMEDWWVSDYLALYNHTPATLTVDCIEDSEVLVLSDDDHQKLAREIHAFSNFFLLKKKGGYVGLQQRILLLLFKNPRERYERLQQLQPKLMQRVPKTLLAAYLGVSRESLSRLYQGEM
ncbi:Crp/Fnr family transcriptional regulator [uncultured Chitinophaga sp.]|uniref:Crp/Fnr family transcriptional regulator n=1 Tax=uncultured Chitinophaga sp. TaxID=339340 RepID=UPI002632F4DC|nr:Crp/Fnr family transcriptional regulator [uncultured Chitinophaga sp.]